MITDTLGDLAVLLLRCASEWMTGGSTVIAIWLVGSLIGSVAAVVLTLYWCRLWNRAHTPRLLEWSGALVLGTITAVAIFLWPAVGLLREVALISIDSWKLQLATDTPWRAATFTRAYEAVKELGLEDFSGHLADIPLVHPASAEKVASVYSQAALEHFSLHWPLLNAILRPDRTLGELKITDAVRTFFFNGGKRYEPENAVEIAATYLATNAETRAPRLVIFARALIAAAWVVAAGTLWAILGWLAFRSLR